MKLIIQRLLCVFCLGLLPGGIALPGQTAEAYSAPRVAVEASAGDNASLIGKFRLAGDYKRRYHQLVSQREALVRQYEDAWQEYEHTLRLIELHKLNEASFEELIRREMAAWARLYRVAGNDGSADSGDMPGVTWPSLRKYEPAVVALPQGGLIARWASRYQYWMERYQAIRAAHDSLSKAHEVLTAELVAADSELQRLRDSVGDGRHFLDREMAAWQRLYRE